MKDQKIQLLQRSKPVFQIEYMKKLEQRNNHIKIQQFLNEGLAQKRGIIIGENSPKGTSPYRKMKRFLSPEINRPVFMGTPDVRDKTMLRSLNNQSDFTKRSACKSIQKFNDFMESKESLPNINGTYSDSIPNRSCDDDLRLKFYENIKQNKAVVMPGKQLKNALKLKLPHFEIMDPPMIKDKVNKGIAARAKVESNIQLFTQIQKNGFNIIQKNREQKFKISASANAVKSKKFRCEDHDKDAQSNRAIDVEPYTIKKKMTTLSDHSVDSVAEESHEDSLIDQKEALFLHVHPKKQNLKNLNSSKRNGLNLQIQNSCFHRQLGRKIKEQVIGAFSENKKEYLTTQIKKQTQQALDNDIKLQKKREKLNDSIFKYGIAPQYKSYQFKEIIDFIKEKESQEELKKAQLQSKQFYVSSFSGEVKEVIPYLRN